MLLLRIIQEYLQPKIGGKIRIFSLALENNILIKKKSVLGTPDAPLLNNWFDNSLLFYINDDCACQYFYEFEFEISNLSSHFTTRHLADTRLKSVINPVLSAIACVAGVERVGDREEGKEEGDSLFPRYCALLPLPFPYPFAPATQASTAEAIVS